MPDIERTFKIEADGGLTPVDNPKFFTRLDAVGVPAGSTLGKASVTSVVRVDNSAADLKKRLTDTPKMATPPKKAVSLRAVSKKNLKSLDQWNQERSQFLSEAGQDGPQKNGIACPKCGVELYDQQTCWSNFNGTFVDIACAAKDCDFSGQRLV